MLYRTHQPFLFHFHPLPSATIPTSSPSPLQKMECVEAALNNSIKTEALVKSSPRAFLDDLWALNAQNGATSGDFFVDDLLDFSNEDGLVEKQEEHEEEEDKVCVSVSPTGENPEEIRSNESANYDFGSVTDSELGVPADDMASLEWLSHFVEDSFTEPSALYPVGILPEKPKISVPDGKPSIPETKPPVSETDTCFKTPLPAKARSKRARNGVRVWSLTSPSSLTESSSSNSSSSSSSSCPSSPWLIYTNPGSIIEPIFANPPGKKQKKKPASEAGSCGSQPRRCSHCGVQKTPQWRAGPLGPKTLCNACGVRYKSGRLLPEYRPACSPTFSSELHSNHHRKVLEMRKTKEVVDQVDSGLALPSF